MDSKQRQLRALQLTSVTNVTGVLLRPIIHVFYGACLLTAPRHPVYIVARLTGRARFVRIVRRLTAVVLANLRATTTAGPPSTAGDHLTTAGRRRRLGKLKNMPYNTAAVPEGNTSVAAPELVSAVPVDDKDDTEVAGTSVTDHHG